MSGRRLLLAAWLAAAPLVSVAADPGRPEALARTRHLEAELALAQKPGFYAVFDLQRREAQLKARGVVFQAWPVSDHRLWGGGLPAGALTLVEKDALFAPQRTELEPPKPGDEEQPAPRPKAFEVGDMPVRFSLRFPEGVTVAVAPRPQGFVPRLRALGGAVFRFAAVPARTLWNLALGRPLAVLDLELDEADARALYWAFTPGMPTLFWFSDAPLPAPPE